MSPSIFVHGGQKTKKIRKRNIFQNFFVPMVVMWLTCGLTVMNWLSNGQIGCVLTKIRPMEYKDFKIVEVHALVQTE